MPLILPSLQQPLTALFSAGSQSPAQSAQMMADAYVAYTATALFAPSVPIFTGLEGKALMATLLAALAPSAMNPAGLGTAWSSGITAFWTGPPIVCAGAAPGTVTAVPGAAAVVAALTAVCSVSGQAAAVAAANMAAAIDAATKTAIALLTVGGVPTPTPIA